VPLIISRPGETPAGHVDDENLVSTGLDLLPTLCDYAGIEPPQGLPGRSARPLAAGRPPESWRDQVVTESSIGRMLRTDRWKYCVYNRGEPREQLNDKKKDPGEMHNLAVEPGHEAVLDEMRGRLARWMDRVDDEIGKEYLIRPGE
ncbi:MAG: sulfatase/phosphatase domain-containing protein, partial [Planctomycetota bacterium]